MIKDLNWLSIETGYIGSYWSGIKVDEGQSLLLGMSGNITLLTHYMTLTILYHLKKKLQ